MSQKILIIDDDPSTRKLMQYTLSKDGYEDISFAATAEEGLVKAKSTAPDLVVLDVFLPDQSGIELCSAIKSDKEIRPKIILITGSLNDMELSAAKDSGADSIIVKTSDYEMLLEEMKKVLSK